ncbi:PAS domain S-box-containing protein [Maribacter orientalis]|uniref:histidine kinase n=1 Tax=Maribacter orientalis TaxID=228957 RepID=A0A1H7NZF7_9FLAO|nr:PAS domain-containing sensor histidine kinase [Maribacter orientalis]SEL28237.1 PAS domain S-box-containing protein [Maribacter orientalis]
MKAKNPPNSALRKKAEAQIKNLPLSTLDLTMEKAKILMHELEVHQIELEMQNQELREAQQQLEKARDEYCDLFDFAPVGYLILNEKGVINNINLTACHLFGIDRLHIKGKPFSAYLSKGEANTFFLSLRQAFKTGTLPTLEFKIKRKDNTYFNALMNGTIDTDQNINGPVCRVAIQDITETRKMEILQEQHEDLERENTKIEKYNQELERIVLERTKELSEALESEKDINEMKSAFITIASHELRTPVTIILSSVILMEKFNNKGEYDKIDRHIQRIKSAIKNFTSILDDFLSLEKLERGVVRVKKETFDIMEFMKVLTEEMEGILKPEQHIHYSHEGNNLVVQNQKILHNILVNLLTNAIKYSETDVMLNTMNRNGELTVIVKDKGIGIPEQDQKNLFKRFFRAENVKDFQGTGLGLSIVKRYVELLNGSIEYVSALSQGSTFTIQLPEN